MANVEKNKVYPNNIVIVGDCRFKNEFELMPEALRIRLECNREVRKERCEMWRDNETHPSEIDLDDYVHINKFDMIFNTATQATHDIAEMVLARLESDIRANRG